MTLAERIERANKAPEKHDEAKESRYFEELKRAFNQTMSSDEIASIAAESMFRAKNEIRRSCAHIFEGEQWAGLDETNKKQLVDKLLDTIFGLGPLEALLHDESITEIMVNGTHSIFYEREGKIYPSNFSFEDDEQVRSLIDRILGPLGRRIDEASPMVNARLERGHRVNAIIPPLSIDGPMLTIRKFRDHIFTLDEMLSRKTLDQNVKQFLTWSVKAQKNIAVSGATGSGKTTFLNALSCEIALSERIITIEDSAELKFSNHPHVVRLEARPRNAEGGGEITIRDLVINALRMRPDRIIVGECRGGEALDMLQAMNTGHDGSMTTLHANSPNDALMRLVTMVRYVADLPLTAIEAQISSAIDIVIQTARAVSGHRYIQEIACLQPSQDGFHCVAKTLFKHTENQEKGKWFSFPTWIDELVLKGIASQEEVQAWKAQVSAPY